MRRTALITGATSGLGLSYAKYFAARGFDLILTGRREEVVHRGEELGLLYGVDVTVLRLELGERQRLEKLLEAVEGRQVDVLVNNAGFGLSAPLLAADGETVERMTYLHMTCLTRLCQTLGRKMVARGRGHIINISSSAAFATAPGSALYAATKRYVLSLTEALALELEGTGVQVQAVCPGMVESDFHKRMGAAREGTWRRLLPFRDPDDVVADAMGDLRRGKVVSVPDLGGKVLRGASRYLPWGVFHRIMGAAGRKMTVQGEKPPSERER